MISRVLYTIAITLLQSAIYLHSFFNEKSKKIIDGRRNWKDKLLHLKAEVESKHKGYGYTSIHWIWVHVSSLGEYEQTLPLITKILYENDDVAVLTTFFSPSGYENADIDLPGLYTAYIPWDYPINSRSFLKILSPVAIYIDKYDFWYNFLHQARARDIPLYLINAYFEKNHWIFNVPSGGFFDIFNLFTHIYTQDYNTVKYIDTEKHHLVQYSGDTRIARVIEIAESSQDFPQISDFVTTYKYKFIAGSTWPEDEKLLLDFMTGERALGSLCLILVPHEVDKPHIERLLELFKDFSPVLYSDMQGEEQESRVLIVDEIGKLKHLYKYFDYAYIGGGFGAGVHSILEALVYKVPTFYGPRHKRSFHAGKLVEEKLSYVVNNTDELRSAFAEAYKRKGEIAQGIKAYLSRQENAVEVIYDDLKLSDD